jgi:hypothetical protein
MTLWFMQILLQNTASLFYLFPPVEERGRWKDDHFALVCDAEEVLGLVGLAFT